MIIMSDTCPGPGWKRLFAAYIICQLTGRVIVPEQGVGFWTRA